jgi:hypothetical protein
LFWRRSDGRGIATVALASAGGGIRVERPRFFIFRALFCRSVLFWLMMAVMARNFPRPPPTVDSEAAADGRFLRAAA